MIKFVQYEKIRGESSRATRKQTTNSPKKSKAKSSLKNSPKSVERTKAEIDVSPTRKLKKEANRIAYKASPSKNIDINLPEKKMIGKLDNSDLMKENEQLKKQNKELQAKIAKLEKTLNPSTKVLFEAEKKLSEMELELKASQIRAKEGDQLIKQLLATIDYMNQDSKSTTKKPTKQKEEQKFLFNKYELVDNHTQLGQIRTMMFDTFKALQNNMSKDNPKAAGMISFLLGKMEELFEVIHNVEIKGLEYLNLLVENTNRINELTNQ